MTAAAFIAAGFSMFLGTWASGFTFDSGIHRYEYIVEDCSWSSALAKARSKGGYLVHIDSRNEFTTIQNELNMRGLKDTIFMIGGCRSESNGEYYWADENGALTGNILNSSDYWGYGCWMKGEPSFVDGSWTEKCMDMYYNTSENRWIWNDVPDDILTAAPFYSGRIGYIVEYEDQGWTGQISHDVQSWTGQNEGWDTDWADDIEADIAQNAASGQDHDTDEARFREVLDQYKEAIEAGEEGYFNADPSSFPDVCEGAMIQYYYYDKDLAYAFYDVDKNGENELLIGEGRYGSFMPIDVVVCEGSDIISFFQDVILGERNSMKIFTDGTLYVHMVDGAVRANDYFYQISWDGTSLELYKTYEANWADYPDRPYSDGSTRMSEESFLNMLSAWVEIKPVWYAL